MNNSNPTIIDVRTSDEYRAGHVAGSINIPLQEIQARFEEIAKIQGPVVLCCASGGRSFQANSFLRSKGIDCVNGGSWIDVNNQMLNQSI